MKTGIYILSILSLILASLPAFASVQFYRVTNVMENDTLNVRSGPGVSFQILKALPYDAKGIEIIKRSGKWVKITTPGSRQLGWVGSRYLKKYSDVLPTGYDCHGTEPFWSIKVADNVITADILDGAKFELPLKLNSSAMNTPPQSRIISGNDEQHSVTAFIREGSCNDGMSDNIQDFYIMTLIDNKAYSGCCNALPAE